ncbi:hypothetical protein MLD38_027031 [Melastoma candidum]|uniref:Uncharacterized protein n=1 Tax=Melastoma candidum TaxID=119954 RepID=A0ACB9P6M0_9MYRT|nr:hypothetical protein MLD38_027031 [Melastoma candidum]
MVPMYSRFYNGYNYHYMEGETMRPHEIECLFSYYLIRTTGSLNGGRILQECVRNNACDITNGLCTPVSNPSAPVYITVKNGGNIEGLTTT